MCGQDCCKEKDDLTNNTDTVVRSYYCNSSRIGLSPYSLAAVLLSHIVSPEQQQRTIQVFVEDSDLLDELRAVQCTEVEYNDFDVDSASESCCYDSEPWFMWNGIL